MERPLVSIVIPLYNVEKYLNRCIQSVVDQSYADLEIILVDDGSTDHCPAICDSWAEKDERIRVIHKSNEGAGKARNTGIDNAGGKYIFFFDSDDWVSIHTVEKCVASAEENHADAVLYGLYDVFDNGSIEKKVIKSAKRIFEGNSILEELLPKLFTYEMGLGIRVSTKMFRLEKIQQHHIRFKSEREVGSEDALFILELFSHLSFVSIVNDYFYFYYKRKGSLSTCWNKNRQISDDNFLLQCAAYVKENNLPDILKLHIIGRYHMYTVAGLKQIMGAELTKKEKKAELDAIYNNKLLRSTIALDVLKYESFSMKIFWIFWKLRGYWICNMLLRCTAKG